MSLWLASHGYPHVSVGPLDLVWMLVLLGASFASARLVPRLWRGEEEYLGRLRMIFGALGPRIGPALIAVVPLAAVVLASAVATFAVAAVAQGAGPLAGPARVVLPWLIGMFAAGLAAALSVVLVGRPKTLVPPSVRDAPGWIPGVVSDLRERFRGNAG